MFLKTLNLQNFRNYSNLKVDFLNKTTILLGNNARGKSNLLESIYVLSTSKSPKADADVELIKHGNDFARVGGKVDNQEEENDLEITFQSVEGQLSKKSKVNGLPKRVVDYIGNLSVVTFSPEEINLVTGSPSLRRWHIDLTLAQIDREYKRALTSYGEIITRRNKVLKMIREGQAQVEELSFWTEEQLSFGKIIVEKRRELFEFLNQTERKFGQFNFEYLENKLNAERLKEYQFKEIASAMSLIGPHRDDFKFKLGDRDLSKFGSRGENRTAVLDLKLSEASFIESKINARPILLLDDVFSELDAEHQEHVLKLIPLQQTILAAVDVDERLKNALEDFKVFYVGNGQLAESADKLPPPPKKLSTKHKQAAR